MTPGELLQRILAVTEGTPYRGTILASSDNESVSLDGDVVFRITAGQVCFDFYIDPEADPQSGYRVTSLSWSDEGEVRLDVPSQDFRYPIRIHSAPHPGPIATGRPLDREKLTGHIRSVSLGSEEALLSAATVCIRYLPDGMWGIHNSYRRLTIVEDGREYPGGSHRLNSLTLRGGGWVISLQEMPKEERVTDVAPHRCTITRDDESTFTGSQVRALLEHDLRPYLHLMFGQYVMWSMVEGHSPAESHPSMPWGMIFAVPSGSVRSSGRSWFLVANGRVDPSPMFERYCSMSSDRKRHFRRVIERYVASETILATIGLFEEAIALSFAGLEGLVRSVISTYPCSDRWLKKSTLELKRNNTIQKAIELVIGKELGRLDQQDALIKAMKDVRNATVHTDLSASESDPQITYYRWQACQFLVEAILLSQLGLDAIPNRTDPGKARILGKEVLRHAQSYTVRGEATE